MLPLLSPRHYFDDQVFQEEVHRIFNKSWLFVGYTFDVEAPASWFTFELFGRSFFVQRDGKALRCFVNSCSHRHSRLRTERCGAGAIVCPYHGWMFQYDGSVNAIPRKPRFCDVSAADLEDLRLQSVPLATWGCLIFAQLEPAGVPWEDFIAPIKERLEPVIQSIGPRKRRLQQKVSANWKSLIENSVEAYHLECVHGETFAKLGLGTTEMHVPAPHCLGVTRVAEETMKRWYRVDGLLSSRIHKTEAYEHAIVFPNCGIGSLYGATVAIEQYLPLSATETLYTADIFACQLGELSAGQQALADAFFQSSCGFAGAIFEEDMRIVQIQQAGLRSSCNRGRLSEDERLIWFLQKQWQDYPALAQM